MIRLIAQLKGRYGLKIVVVSNEGRELNAHRIKTFKLADLADVFISSCFIHLRKPDADIFLLALDVAQTAASQVIYLDDTPMFVQIAEGLGIRGIRHVDEKSTRAKLASFGLSEERRSVAGRTES
jgi:putative hydrolase of the HAD superfamily